MELFVSVMFWMSAVSVVLRAALMSITSYPRTAKFGPGTDVFVVLSNAALSAWAAYLLWGAQ